MADDPRYEVTDPGANGRGFGTTLWSVVLRAKDRSSPQGRQALNALVEKYWKPVYFYVRYKGENPESAQDLTQDFFISLMEREFLDDVDPAKGRFRAYLLTSLRHFLLNRFERRRAQKRGGDKTILSLDYASGESELSLEPPDRETPEKAFDRKWALTVLKEALEGLKTELIGGGHENRFKAFQRYLSLNESGTAASYARIAGDLGFTEAQVNNYIHRARARLLEILRERIRGTVAEDSETESELQTLFSALG